jgi:pSer/pThr/pTyr-binding forkhead associated (FHA) protein
MPLIRCPKCEQAYEVPAAVAVKLPSSLARCVTCGEMVFGTKEARASRFAVVGDIDEVHLNEWIVASVPDSSPFESLDDFGPAPSGTPRSLRVIARGADSGINEVFTIGDHPLWIGRSGCHIELVDAELSIRHCQIVRRGDDLFLRDLDSHTGTFLDGEPVVEAKIGDGVHLIRVGHALVCVEPVSDSGTPVEPIELESQNLFNVTPELMRKLQEKKERAAGVVAPKRSFLVCFEGPLSGREYEIPKTGLTVGREGNVRVPDEFLSRKHFVVSRDEDGALRVRDLGSRNGTFLNTLPARNTRVRPGDEIRAGVNAFRVEERP